MSQEQQPRLWRMTLVYAGLAVAVNLPFVLFEWIGLNLGVIAIIQALLFLAALAVTSIGVLLLPFCWSSRRFARVGSQTLWAFAFAVTSFAMMRLEGKARDAAFAAMTERAEPLVEAIGAFEGRYGRPPARLGDLVPEFLSEVPGTGLPSYPAFVFQRTEGRTHHVGGWELSVPCSLGFLNWDVCFYWPSEDYPDAIYGGVVERIGRWAYVHE